MATTTMNRTAPRWPLLIVMILLVTIAGLLVFSIPALGGTVPLVREPVNQGLGGATRADVEIEMGVGQLYLGALAEPIALISGEIVYPEANRVTRAFALEGDTATFKLSEQDSQANSLIKYKSDTAVWNLELNPTTPLRLRLHTGIGESSIDLSKLHVTDLALATTIGGCTLTLPSQGQVEARVDGGIGKTAINIPAGMAVRLTFDVNIGSVTFPDNYQKRGDAYVSPGFDTATNYVDLTASSGIGSVAIQSVSE